MRRNQPYKVEPMNPRNEARHPAPDGKQNVAQDGYERLAQADARTGIRQVTGGTPVYPPYHEDL